MKQAGHINYLVHQEIEKYLKPGTSLKKIDSLIKTLVEKQGGTCSCYGYEGFPSNACISLNDEVVHGIPDDRKIKNGDLLKIDFTVRKDGYESDMTKTYIIGTVKKEVEDFVKRTEQSLYEGLKVIKHGAKLGDIGYAISSYAHKYGYSVVEELTGHGIGSDMHEEPEVPNYGEKDKGLTLKEGMTLAIEPMLNMGSKEVYMADNNWTILTDDESYSAHFEHTILVTKDGYEILTGE